jgi:ornithine--oxo-acid transaminase
MPKSFPTLMQKIYASRAGEEMALNNRYLNHQMGRIVRTIGFDRTWVEGDGAHLIDSEGRRYLDLLGGLGVFGIGRNHPGAITAVEDVLAARTANLPKVGATLLNGVLAERLIALAPDSVSAMVPASTGAEAVEASMKIARAATGRSRIIYAENAFHGVTLGALSVNGHAEFRDGFGPLLPGCDSVPFGDLDALGRELARGDVAAFITEPIQGRGVHLPPAGYLQGAQRLCKAAGALFICDEVQTGIGRTGRFLALEHWGLEPDMICLSKALSGGLVPIGAVLVSRAAFDRVFDRMRRVIRHGSTFGGNDLAAAAALATLQALDEDDLIAHAERMGALLMVLTQPLVERYEIVREVRGLGLMWAIELAPPQRDGRRSVWSMIEQIQPGVFSQLITVPLFHDHRILCQVAGARLNVIKILPPLVIDEQEIRRFAAALEEVVASVENTSSAMVRLGWRMARHHSKDLWNRRTPASNGTRTAAHAHNNGAGKHLDESAPTPVALAPARARD